MSGHYHYEYAEARHDHRGEYADDRHDHDTDYAEKYHRHHDLESEDERLKALLDQWQADLRELRSELEEALGRIRDLEQQTPEARQAEQEADIAAADLAGSGYDPGPEVDDEGGMSEYRYVMPEDYERGQS